MSNLSEQALNIELGNRLADMLPSFSKIETERTKVLAKNPSKRPDISIPSKGRSPVIIEAEYMPATNVEKDAYRYFEEPGLNKVRNQTHPIEAAIAVRYPKKLAQAKKIDEVLETTRQLSYCALYPKGKRFPTTGWLEGSISDLADLIHLVDVPRSAFDKCADDLRKSIDGAVSQFQYSRDILTNQIFNLLGLVEVLKTKDLSETKKRKEKKIQTGRVAGAIIANALIFHERIANAYEGILPINQICGHPVYSSKKAALKAWEDILNINYWPIFKTASQIIGLLPAGKASSILKTLTNAAERIHEDGLLYEHDLTGHVFQDLIIDRKYLAAFYTLPESAALLARLAVAKMKVDWKDKEAIGQLKIADFACGTGALLSAVYDQIANRYERAGGNPEKLHKSMMEQVLYGFDVLPYAAHLTASILSGKEPATIYDRSRIYTMPYGRQKDGTVEIGSLEFLDKPEQRVLFHTGDPAKRIGSAGEEAADLLKANVPNESLDLVIMNPPFTRNVTREGAYEGTYAAAFAAFAASDEDQRDMAKRLNALGKGTCYHGNAGIASAFVALADKKLKPGGILALVLPLTASAGASWQKLRTLLAKNYTEVEVVSLADAKCYDVAFSSDTSMADCLVIASKKSANIPQASASPTRFISLLQRPANFAVSAETAKQLAAEKTIRKLEDGPFGGEEVVCGQEKMGETIQANVQREKPKWNLVRIQDFELIQTAYKLTQSQLWLPARKEKPLAMTELKNVGDRGLLSLDLTGPAPFDDPIKKTQSRLPRGPFDLSDSSPKPTDTYPTLWNHDAKKETRLICKPDKKLIARPGMEDKANEIWLQFAGRCHLTVDFTLGSQPLSVAITEEPSIGGRAWVNINFAKKSWDYAFAIWGNSTLGLLLFWWHGNRQQPGRSGVSVTASTTLPVLDFRALSPAQIKQAKAIFDEFKDKHFLPAYVANEDPTREDLDRKVLCDWLGFDKSTFQAVRELAKKWCAEPSVHGGKEKMGETILTTVSKNNPTWNPVRIQDFELIQTAYKLTQSQLWLPARKEKPLAMTELKNVGDRGLLSLDLTGPAPFDDPIKKTQSRLPRGPFDLSDSSPKPTDTYPTLWNHDAKKETRLICKPDKKLIARPRMGGKANEIWLQFAGRCHFNLNFTLGSQPLAVAFTEEQCIGGDAWPNVNFPKNKDWDYAFSIWGNSTLGLLCHWWHANRQQPGRSRVSITASETLPVLDFRALSDAQIKQAKAIFDEFKDKHFLPAYVANEDPTREDLDRKVLCDWLGFDKSTFQAVRELAKKWCAEPSVHGGKQRHKNNPLIT